MQKWIGQICKANTRNRRKVELLQWSKGVPADQRRTGTSTQLFSNKFTDRKFLNSIANENQQQGAPPAATHIYHLTSL
ncbi:hypothetical protein DYBT9275_05821 [Dyadobacter sp. CECT 9275]|uniref:Uncharacterized protein n=1 Tax=Dyadobacter helix TaxID=2822344 RepID=A0A916JKE6_9BACT|nr:hypothetical protein DYBT9275_05821 [Dyadobacter sp. CECT 9275]